MVSGAIKRTQETEKGISTDNLCVVMIPKKNKVVLNKHEKEIFICKNCGLTKEL